MKIYEYFALVSAGTKLFPESNEFEDQKIITTVQLYVGYIGFNQNKKLVCLNPEKDTYVALDFHEPGKKAIEDVALMKFDVEQDCIVKK